MHTRQRARELLPSVLLTLLSMIQALALETFWSHFQANDSLWLGGWPALLGWLQVVGVTLGITLIWLVYVSVLLRFSWVPGIRDMLVPFGIGLIEFMLVDLQGPEQVGQWLLCVAVAFAVVIGESHMIFRQARRDPMNRQFFAGVEPAKPSDYYGQAIVIGVMAALGLAVMWTGSQRWLALVSLVFVIAAFLRQFAATHYYWKISITDAPEAPESTDGPGLA